MYLAKKGFDVTAIEVSANGVRKLERLAKDRNLSITVEIQDMREFEVQTD